MHRTLECVGASDSFCTFILVKQVNRTLECVGASAIFGDDALLSLVFFEVTRQVYSGASAADKNISQVHITLLKVMH